MLKNLLILIIKAYKKLFSPLLPNSCRYYPTCSDYAVQSIEKHGSIKGSFYSIRRVLSCNRFSRSGYDPVDKGCR